ncbi:MAG: hypothetical protein KU38_05695 [Sulfurovum sp. FS08-3]|nr:MAG: hypothetical protein KU38_05695 [Sulfurovum sp. FS08-3]
MKKGILFTALATLALFANPSHHHGTSPMSCSKPSSYLFMDFNHSVLELNQAIETTITLTSEMGTKMAHYQVVVDERLELLYEDADKTEQIDYDKVVIKLKTLANAEDDYFITIYAQTYAIDEPLAMRYSTLLVPIQIGKRSVRKVRSLDKEERLKIYHGMESVR